jgi:hypothetical protein
MNRQNTVHRSLYEAEHMGVRNLEQSRRLLDRKNFVWIHRNWLWLLSKTTWFMVALSFGFWIVYCRESIAVIGLH